MSRTRAQLRYGLWPDVPGAPKEPVELTAAARAQGLAATEELARLGAVVTLDSAGKAHFRRSRVVMPAEARRAIEAKGDLIEATLIERARSLKG